MISSLERPKQTRVIIVALTVLILVTVMVFVVRSVWFTAVQSQKFYAVFIDNGQVYFGKVTRQTENEIVLEYVFYLKADTDLSYEEVPNANLSLIKFGNEIYKPYDRILINRSHVLFLEEMRPGSEIMKAIEKYEQEP